ncbi:hypothetical protein [Micromonospora chokoriensis]|uniref:hypothetical protein n=1 Tax=Micromonospora chokoriensis TaxID=356851 RepID=UPI001E65BC6F|nr:hypothetical protein [Micromonospora chokoriensis]
MFDGGGVAVAGGDAQAEQVGQSADVSVGGLGFVEDAVLADVGGGQPGSGSLPDPGSADGSVGVGGSGGHEQVGIVGAWPPAAAVVEPSGQCLLNGLGQGYRPVVDVQHSVADVGEPQHLHLAGAHPVESDERGDRGVCGVGRGQGLR